MTDPLAEIVTLLRPSAPFSKLVCGAGQWSVRREEYGQPFYCVALEGSCQLAVDGHEPVVLNAGDFVLIPSAGDFTMSAIEPAAATSDIDLSIASLLSGEIRHGRQSGPPDIRLRVGHCVFGSPDAALLVSLLPQLIHIRGDTRLATLAHLVGDESRAMRPARDVIMERLLEVLLIEALRSNARTALPPGLLRGLADERLMLAIRALHENPTRRWTVADLAKQAGLSRSAFFDRFQRLVGVSPMEYLLAWRMALAKNMLRHHEGGVGEIAERVGYGSASAFSVAFTRHVGLPPSHYAEKHPDVSTN
ncbi:AraC family transcriptional regulator [Hoeflea sp. G2-23]|uniref:AraC family transcriptional regulator n=1 Tax=Hoeflea algicola TaxID=2983763 RepID=A0ABT3Z8F6_9HYPH|nr:AraC family transcriptional regulator [Hoeflea algicola]MCY0147619.1 AraC family transcriptional regulator [Hoeflea algicola]